MGVCSCYLSLLVLEDGWVTAPARINTTGFSWSLSSCWAACAALPLPAGKRARMTGLPTSPGDTGCTKLTDVTLSLKEPSRLAPEVHGALQSPDKLDAILVTIKTPLTLLEVNVDTVAEEIRLIRQDHQKLVEQVTHTECSLTDLQPQVSDLRKQMWGLTERVQFLKACTEDTDELSGCQGV
ncbi:hypothetical protein NDU88_007049 [Pleurodeles waltl]|uniref:Uncharacterized protein n=1 Tax=Pleurodeles waltl TaxID=8319 RepID=A0AAV7TZA8_PLEWA|nr:hypothetical protein NDU88_007049 [Pleurodeles waltl]